MLRQDRASGDPLFPSIYPKTRVCLLYCFMLSPSPLTLQGAAPPPPTSLREGVRAPANKIPGHDKSVSVHKLL